MERFGDIGTCGECESWSAVNWTMPEAAWFGTCVEDVRELGSMEALDMLDWIADNGTQTCSKCHRPNDFVRCAE